MPKNLKGGNKHKKKKNHNINLNKEIILKDSDSQDYAKVIKLLGNCRVLLLCNDKKERLGIIRGNMRKTKWINMENIVLYSKREYENDKVDIIFVYDNEMINNNYKIMNLTFNINQKNNDDDDLFTYLEIDEININNI
jgi:initiation factor 1A